ncbi:hypothetical protein [Mannheimia pernigra]|uniref:Uncharacterized protein n=1 Tax=Mannheimia pernigra TaxID=111844 RepID=A0A7D5HTK0_9PAST|nr:hypothetical protein [Mannheimia pernigra]QLB39391.1 hypothetical protein HV559_06260 [Mannheimia pernigra]
MIDEKLFQMLISFVVAPLVAFVGKVIFDRINRNEQTVIALAIVGERCTLCRLKLKQALKSKMR